jgi:IS605 OrfB family transposase
MKLIAQVKLLPDARQADALRRTLEVVNEACNYVSERAWQTRTWNAYGLHKLLYYEIRERFDLSAQIVVRLLAKVADAYKLDRKTKRTFKAMGGIGYDDRILRWYMDKSFVSIWTVEGRLQIPFVCGERQRELLSSRMGESDLFLFRNNFFLLATCDVEEPEPIDVEGVLGVDLGVTNIAVDSDGEVHSSSQVNNVRHRNRRLRTKLQRKGTKSARRRLRQLSGRESRFGKWVNHNISKRIVTKAQDTKLAVALENLEGISQRVTVRKPQRATLHSWSFFQLRSFIEYKAHRAGVPVVLVDPKNTSRTCPVCGCVDKRNRPSQSTFSCISCGHAGLADNIAAINIGRRAVVNPPNVSTTQRVNESTV